MVTRISPPMLAKSKPYTHGNLRDNSQSNNLFCNRLETFSSEKDWLWVFIMTSKTGVSPKVYKTVVYENTPRLEMANIALSLKYKL